MAACGSIPLLGIFVGNPLMIALMAAFSGLALVAETARLKYPDLNRLLVARLKPLLKESESRRITGATYIALSSLAAFLVFDSDVAVTALFFLALGDPAAALVGSRVGGVRLAGKSPWGTLAFVTVSLTMVGALSAAAAVSFHWALLGGAAVAAAVELAPLGVDDNVSIPLISGGAMSLMMGV